jgi:PAS domain S-box-containing protein
MLFEAAEATGISRTEITGPLGLDPKALADTSRRVEWATLVSMMEQVSRLVDGDPTRIQRIGTAMMHTPTNAALQRIARTVTSIWPLYQLGARWVAPANFPHIPCSMTKDAWERLVVTLVIPEPHAPSEPFLHVAIGAFLALPRLLALSDSRISSCRVTSRTLDLLLELPADVSLLGRARRRLKTALHWGGRAEVLEQQRAALSEGMDALHRQQNELRNVLERLPDMVMIHVAGTIVWLNRACARALGYQSSDELIGQPIVSLADPRSLEALTARMRQPPDAPGPDLTEVWIRTRTGGSLLIEIAPTQAVVFDGAPARLIVGRDIDERVRLQQRLVVSDRLASLGLLAAGVAHEVNNPLGYILNNIEIASKDLLKLGSSGARSHEALSVALEGVDRIRVIVRDLLMLARGGHGALSPTDVRSVVESTLALAKAEIERTARLVCELRPVPLAHANEPRVAQVVLNLVLNGLEAMRDSDRQTSVLLVRLDRAGDRVVIEVSDTGVGIPPVDLPRIFDPFFTTKPAGEGTGLGLAITQRLVVELGGEIEVESTVAVGTTFRVFLPSEQDERHARGATDRAPAPDTLG